MSFFQLRNGWVHKGVDAFAGAGQMIGNGHRLLAMSFSLLRNGCVPEGVDAFAGIDRMNGNGGVLFFTPKRLGAQGSGCFYRDVLSCAVAADIGRGRCGYGDEFGG